MKRFLLSTGILFIISTALVDGCKDNSDDCTSVQTVDLRDRDKYVPYIGNEQLRFLHNNTDTQTFKSIGKEIYYVQEDAKEGGCPYQYESVKVDFKNINANDIFSLIYERDRSAFTTFPSFSFNEYTFYKLKYKGKLFLYETYNSGNNAININGTMYYGVTYIGIDTTTNYVAYKFNKGILRIRVNGENWDLIP